VPGPSDPDFNSFPSTRSPCHACLLPENFILAKVFICNFKTKLLNCIGQKAIVVYLSQHFLEAAVVTQSGYSAFCQDSNQRSVKCKGVPATIHCMLWNYLSLKSRELQFLDDGLTPSELECTRVLSWIWLWQQLCYPFLTSFIRTDFETVYIKCGR